MDKVGISCDTHSVRNEYLDGTNLDYEVRKDGAHIHGNYLKWVENVVRDISVQLNLAEAQSPG